MLKSKKVLCTVISSIMWASYTSTAAANEQPSYNTIEELVVTARKKSENMQEVPLSISAMSETMMAEAGINSLGDISDFTPGFDFAQSFGRQDFRPSIRGQSTIDGGANAGLFIDGFYVGQGGPSVPTAALQRIEVVKGPQSTLYGRATLAGAINYVLKKPTDEFEGEVEATIGEYGEVRTDITLSGPLSDTVSYLVAGSYYDYDGQYKNRFEGNSIGSPANNDDVGGQSTDSFLASLTFTPSDTFDGNLTVMWDKSKDDPYAIAMLDSSNNNCGFGPAANPPAGTPGGVMTPAAYNNSGYYCGRVDVDDVLDQNGGRTNLENGFYQNMGSEFEALRTYLTLNWTVGDYDLVSRTGYSDYKSENRQDQGFGSRDYYEAYGYQMRFGTLSEDLRDSNEFSQEFTLHSSADEPFRYMLGTSYYRFESSGEQRLSNVVPTAATDPGRDLFPLYDVADQTVENVSFYGSVSYDFTDTVTLDLELRQSKEKVSFEGTSQNFDFSETYSALLPRASLSWKATDDLMVYGNISKGNKPGTINAAINLHANQRAVDEETAWNYELGFKSNLFDGIAQLNGAVYYIDWENQQLTTNTTNADGTGSTSILQNLGESSIKGLELDLTVNVTDNWQVYAGYAYTDTEVEEFVLNARGFANPTSGAMANAYKEAAQMGFDYLANGDIMISGVELPQVSKHQATLSNSFFGALTDELEWFARVDYVYGSKRYAQVYNAAHTGASSKVNLRVGVNAQDWDVALWVNNVTDNDTSPALIRYVQTQDGAYGPNRAIAATLPEKRAAGVTVNYRF